MTIHKSGTYTVDPPTTPPEPKKKGYAYSCGCEVYEGEQIFGWDNKGLCPDHFKDEIRWFLDENYPERLTLLADMLGVEYETVGGK